MRLSLCKVTRSLCNRSPDSSKDPARVHYLVPRLGKAHQPRQHTWGQCRTQAEVQGPAAKDHGRLEYKLCPDGEPNSEGLIPVF